MKIIFEEEISTESMNKISEELDKNYEFELSKENICEFFHCKEIIKMLEESKIEYKTMLEEPKSENRGKRILSYGIKLKILIPEADYIRNKEYFYNENMSNEEEFTCEDYDDTTKFVYKLGSILVSMMYGSIGLVLLGAGIWFLIGKFENKLMMYFWGIIFVILGILITKKILIDLIQVFSNKKNYVFGKENKKK